MKLSSHMYQISEHINFSNHKIHSHDQMGKLILNLSNKKCEENNKSTGHINNVQKLLLMSIVGTPKNMYQMLIVNLTRENYVHIQ